MKWSNWSGNQSADVRQLHFARSVESIQGLVRSTTGPVRVAGSGHSHSPLVPTSSTIVDMSAMSGLIEADTDRHLVRAWAGTKIKGLAHQLHLHGLGFKNQGDIDQQAIAGATATGTHGSGARLQSFSAAVVGSRVVTAAGEIVEINRHDTPELFDVSRLSLGALGVTLDVTLEVREAYRVAETAWTTDYDTIRPNINSLMSDHRHFEFFMTLPDKLVTAKTIVETTEPAVYPLADEGARVAWSHEVLSNHRSWLHTEMEFAVPWSQALECLDEICEITHPTTPELVGPIQLRSLAADDVWLSTAYGRDSATISVHFDVRGDDEPYFRQCQEVFGQYGGRPHWGKVHYMGGPELEAVHPRWSDWQAARATIDLEGRFLNETLREWFA